MAGHVDGNAIAGMLSEFFRFDVTTARARCGSCRSVAVLAVAMVYGGEQGTVVRCAECGNVLMVVVPAADSIRVQLRGMAWVEV